ncbi:MAG TPA: hypothetical protein VGI03_10500 [Verrucomicrobiae bacterium]|jgi:hypothetical protein
MSKPSSTGRPANAKFPAFILIAALLAIVLAALFYQCFESGMVLFSNDGPLGQVAAQQDLMPGILSGGWQDLNSIGSNFGSTAPNVSSFIRLFWEGLFKEPMGSLGFLNTYTPAALFILGLGAWAFFRKLKLSALAATLGALAVMLNTQLFSGACWGVASDQIAFGFDFLALALVAANDDEPAAIVFWTRIALAGLCVGMNVMEAADVGALCSVFVALYIFFKSFVESSAPVGVKIGHGIARVAVVSVFAGFIATQTVLSLISTQIQGVTTTGQNTQSETARWDFATQWSLPKQETLGIFVPGLFGYRMDTPLNTVPFLQHLYAGGVYWGGVGRAPEIDRYFDTGARDNPPSGPADIMRFGYGGYYCGILVALVAFWAVAQLFRKRNPTFTDVQKKFIWFWCVTSAVTLVLAWGRFEPSLLQFFRVFFHLPGFSYMRNPGKFLVFVEWGITVLFAYGIHGISQRYLAAEVPPNVPVKEGVEKEEDTFDQKWLYAAAGIFGVSVFGWLMYASMKPSFVQYLKYRGFGDEETAKAVASFSIAQAGWFLFLFAVALVLLAIVINGYCAGRRAKWAAAVLGLFLVFDLGRADLPFIVHWNIKQKYEVGELNPVVDFLRQQPYEHRVAQLPFSPPPGLEELGGLYGIEWSQHLFPYYDIQSLDIIQMPRPPVDLTAYEQMFLPQDPSQAFLYARWWQLTNTRYLLGPAGYLEVMNAQLDPAQHRFQIARRFNIGLKPEFQQYNGDSSELTAYSDDNGPYALFDFTGVLPRAKLYTTWQALTADELKNFSTNSLSPLDSLIFSEAGTNGFLNLKKLAAPSFDPDQTVLLDAPLPGASPTASNETNGTVAFQSYAPKHVVLSVNAVAPSVLLLNDHYDPNWHVTIDGQPAPLFKANFIMQGVLVPAGQHTVEYQFTIPDRPFYVTVSAICVGLVLCGVMICQNRPRKSPATKTARRF